MSDTQEVMELSLEKVIESKLVQNNVTEQVLAALKDKYGKMKLAALDDKESYLELKAAAKECAKVRTLTVKLCKEGREEAVKTQKLWIAKEKEIVGEVDVVESALDAEIAKYDNEVKRKEQEEIKRQEEAYINRQATLNKMGARYEAGSFVLGEASFEADLVKGMDNEIWENDVVPKFQAEYEKIEAVRVAEEKAKAEREEEMRAEQEKLRKEQEAFRLQQEQFKQQQEEAARKENERIAEEKRLKAEADNNRWRSRLALLDEAGWNGQFAFPRLGDNEAKIFTYDELVELSDETFTLRMKEYNQSTAVLKKEIADKAEQKRVADIEEAKQKAIIDEQNKQKKLQEEAEEKKRQDELKKQQELEAANDKTKWDEVIKYLKNCPKFEMRSGQYRKKNQIYTEKIEEILSL